MTDLSTPSSHEAILSRVPAFPFGLNPEQPLWADRPDADTVNRLLLRAARFHDRVSVFVSWAEDPTGSRWVNDPDWRADRHTVRVALVLRQRLQVTAGERVALWLPLRVEWPVLERAIWSVGATTVPVWPSWGLERVGQVLRDSQPAVLFAADRLAVNTLRIIGGLPDTIRAVILLEGEAGDPDQELPYARFMDYGGVLDTAERAAMWRTMCAMSSPDDVISHEYEADAVTAVTHAEWVEALASVAHHFKPERGRVQIVCDPRPSRAARALVYSGWADGFTQTVFAATDAARRRVTEFDPDLVVGDSDSLPTDLVAPDDRISSGKVRTFDLADLHLAAWGTSLDHTGRRSDE